MFFCKKAFSNKTSHQPTYLIFLSQFVYIYQILTHFGMQDATLISTLLTVKYNLSVFQSEVEKHAYREYVGNIHYLSLVRSFLFITQTWPNIQFVINLIARFRGNIDIAHLKATKYILYYFKSIMNFGLVLEKQIKRSFDLVK